MNPGDPREQPTPYRRQPQRCKTDRFRAGGQMSRPRRRRRRGDFAQGSALRKDPPPSGAEKAPPRALRRCGAARRGRVGLVGLCGAVQGWAGFPSPHGCTTVLGRVKGEVAPLPATAALDTPSAPWCLRLAGDGKQRRRRGLKKNSLIEK
jgi:hypothetical protein